MWSSLCAHWKGLIFVFQENQLAVIGSLEKNSNRVEANIRAEKRESNGESQRQRFYNQGTKRWNTRVSAEKVSKATGRN